MKKPSPVAGEFFPFDNPGSKQQGAKVLETTVLTLSNSPSIPYHVSSRIWKIPFSCLLCPDLLCDKKRKFLCLETQGLRYGTIPGQSL